MKNQEINKQAFASSYGAGKLVVLGGGESGVGTAILGKQKGYDVFVSDAGEIGNKFKEVLLKNEISFEENKHTESKKAVDIKFDSRNIREIYNDFL